MALTCRLGCQPLKQPDHPAVVDSALDCGAEERAAVAAAQSGESLPVRPDERDQESD